MKRAIPLLLLGFGCAAAVVHASTRNDGVDIKWSAPSVYVLGRPFPVELELEAGSNGATIAGWMLSSAAFGVDGSPLGERVEGPLIPLAPDATLSLSFDLAPYLVPSADFELSFAGVADAEPVNVRTFSIVEGEHDFMAAADGDLAQYHALFETNRGSLVLEFWPDVAPNHVRNFLDLCHTGFYEKTLFHRVSPSFMIQGGCPNTKTGYPNTWGAGQGPRNNKAEFSDRKHLRGVLSAARLGHDMDSATSQFFLMVRPSKALDNKYSAFGKLIDGYDTLDRIAKSPGVQNPDTTVRPNDPQRIEKALVLQPLR